LILPLLGSTLPSNAMGEVDGMATYGERMRELRIKAGLTQEEVARRIDHSLSIVRDWEANRKLPSCHALYKVAEVLGVNCTAFDGCTPPEKKPKTPKGGRKKKSGGA
jgi:transcriptional regulator with XRE-family HTH domain